LCLLVDCWEGDSLVPLSFAQMGRLKSARGVLARCQEIVLTSRKDETLTKTQLRLFNDDVLSGI
jgi:hypothetical protein